MQFREACLDDAAAACEVVRRSITDLCHADHRGDGFTLTLWLANKTPENMRRWIGSHCTFVATDGMVICGVGMVTGAGEILLNYVSPDARFRGVSKGIIAGLEACARSLRVEAVTLQSSTTAVLYFGRLCLAWSADQGLWHNALPPDGEAAAVSSQTPSGPAFNLHHAERVESVSTLPPESATARCARAP